MKLRLKRSNQHGDTIVEVLIAVAVISSVLVGAFIVAQQSAQAVRNSQEQSEMTQILQGQVELVRSLALAAPDTNAPIFKVSPKYFCIDVKSSPTAPLTTYHQRVDSTALTSLPAASSDTYVNYDPACKDIQNLYNVAITYDISVNPHVFRFYGRWDHIGGGKNEERLIYRVYPGGN